jgi:hypothetical protein
VCGWGLFFVVFIYYFFLRFSKMLCFFLFFFFFFFCFFFFADKAGASSSSQCKGKGIVMSSNLVAECRRGGGTSATWTAYGRVGRQDPPQTEMKTR